MIKFCTKQILSMMIKTFFQKHMRIVNEILLKIIEKLKKNKFLKKVFESWINLLKIRENLSTLLNILDINDKIRNFK